MARRDQLLKLQEGLEAWNRWRFENPGEPIDLSGADLTKVNIGLMDTLRKASANGGVQIPAGVGMSFIYNEIIGYDLMPLNLRAADLRYSNLDGVDLIKADCEDADFSNATLRNANLHRADLSSAKFIDSDLTHADLRATDLSQAIFIRTALEGTDLGYSVAYGVSVWGVKGTPADETSLLITPYGEEAVRTDCLALAQLIYFLIREERARDLIDTIASRLVLILGNFNEERKSILEAVRTALRKLSLLPLIFDFKGPSGKDTTGTVETLARLSRFVIADLTDPSSVPHELATIVPFLRTTPVLLIRQRGAAGYSMASDLKAYPWVLGISEYDTPNLLLEALASLVQQATELQTSLSARRSEA